MVLLQIQFIHNHTFTVLKCSFVLQMTVSSIQAECWTLTACYRWEIAVYLPGKPAGTSLFECLWACPFMCVVGGLSASAWAAAISFLKITLSLALLSTLENSLLRRPTYNNRSCFIIHCFYLCIFVCVCVQFYFPMSA